METESENRTEAVLLKYWFVLRSRWGLIALFTAALVGTTTLVSLITPKTYAAIATLEIQPKAPTIFNVEEVTELVDVGNPDERRSYYSTQYLIIQSRLVMEEAIRRLREEHGVTDFDEEENPVRFLRDIMTLQPEMNTFVVQIRVEQSDPEKAALFANVIAESYRDLNLRRAMQASQDALKWLEEQQEKYRLLQRESDEELHRFRTENDLVGADERREAIFQNLERLQTAQSETHISRIEAQSDYDRLSGLLNNGDWLGLATYLSADDLVLQDRLKNLRLRQQEATGLGTRYLPDHPRLRELASEISGLEAQVQAQVQEIVAGRRTALQVIIDREAALETEIAQAKADAQDLERRLIEYNFLAGAAERNEAFYRNLDQRRSEVDLAKLIESNNVSFIDRAIANPDPVAPRLDRNVAVALLVGVMGGFALVFFMEYIDRTIKGPEDIERLIKVPALGPVPMLSPDEILGLSELDRSIYVYARPKSQVAERLRDIRTNVLFRTPDHRQRRLLITSALPMEGKSFISANLCSIIAMTGHRVLLIDADLRRPTQHKLFQMDASVGLGSVLLGEATIEQAIQHTHVPNLDIMVGGPTLPASVVSPAELFDGDRMTRVLDNLPGYDIVVVDTSPIGAVADPLILSRFVDGVLMVVFASQTPRQLVKQAADRLREMEANILGAVVNKFDVRRAGYGYSYYYNYGYGYGVYGEDSPEDRKTG